MRWDDASSLNQPPESTVLFVDFWQNHPHPTKLGSDCNFIDVLNWFGLICGVGYLGRLGLVLAGCFHDWIRLGFVFSQTQSAIVAHHHVRRQPFFKILAGICKQKFRVLENICKSMIQRLMSRKECQKED